MGTKNKPAQFDCYANADDDEPMFVLLARDRDAPMLVRLWAMLRERSGEDPTKVREARQCAADMELWRSWRGSSSTTHAHVHLGESLDADGPALRDHLERDHALLASWSLDENVAHHRRAHPDGYIYLHNEAPGGQ